MIEERENAIVEVRQRVRQTIIVHIRRTRRNVDCFSKIERDLEVNQLVAEIERDLEAEREIEIATAVQSTEAAMATEVETEIEIEGAIDHETMKILRVVIEAQAPPTTAGRVEGTGGRGEGTAGTNREAGMARPSTKGAEPAKVEGTPVAYSLA